MKKRSPLVLAACCTVAIALPAVADDCKDPISLIELPGRQCFNLNHLTVLGQSRANLSSATQTAIDALDSRRFSGTSTRVTLSDKTGLVMTRASDTQLSPQELETRQKIAERAVGKYSEAASSNEEIERVMFPIQLRTMNAVSGKLANSPR